MASLRRAAATPDLTAKNIIHTDHDVQTHHDGSSSTHLQLRRTRRCTGCRESHDNHAWGMPGPFCQGRSENQPNDNDHGEDQQDDQVDETDTESMTSSLEEVDSNLPSGADEKLLLEQKFRALCLQQQELEQLEALRAKIAQKEAHVSKLRQSQNATLLPQQPATTTTKNFTRGKETLKSIRKKVTDPAIQPSIQHLLAALPATSGVPPGLPWQTEIAGASAHHQQQSLHSQFMANEALHSNMFLAPASVPQGEKVLRIVDFLTNIVPKETEQTISNVGGSRLVISYGQQRPRLEGVSLSQWVVANTRIFHHLLFANKLPNSRDIRDYLAYTVKIMELPGKYEWVSVLKFDDEYRQLQATYSFPWSYDSHHLHEVTLVPIVKMKPTPNVAPHVSSSTGGPPTAVYSAEGQSICRRFNSPSGCQFPNCSFSHVCNRKFKGKACGSSHPATQHGSQGGPTK